MYKIDVYIPIDSLEIIQQAIGPYCITKSKKYSCCMSWHPVNSSWLPNENANPYKGTIGKIEYAQEYVLSFRVHNKDINTVLKLLKNYHPYEEPAIDIIKLSKKSIF